MRIDPAIAALRGDRALQRQAQQVMEIAKRRWLAQPAVARLEEELGSYAVGCRLEDCLGLSEMFEGGDIARDVTESLVAEMLAALHGEPLGQVPFRHSTRPGFAMLQLLASGNAVLSLAIYEGSAQSPVPTESIAFPDVERHEVVLAGVADARIVRRTSRHDAGAVLEFESIRLSRGSVLAFEGNASARVIDRIEGRLLVLRLNRTPAQPEPAEEFRLADGALLHRAAGSKLDTHREMALELLGRMGRSDAAPLFERLAQAGSAPTRWLAVRECLALDTFRGFRALSRIAADPQDELAAPAGALRAQLLEAHPQLEDMPCPA